MIQAIPNYAMSCFKLPAGFCDDLCSMANRFWWGQRKGERKIHWLGKQKLIRIKSEGGIGFRDLKLFNKALLARQGWRLLQNPSSLVFRMLKAKYFPNTSFLEALSPGNASFIWRSICEAKSVLHDGLRWRVGNGEKIKIWGDKWLPSNSTYQVISPKPALDAPVMVHQLICNDTMTWDVNLLDRFFLPRDVEAIKSIPLSHRRPADLLIWSGTKRGVFSVRSAYHMLLNQSQVGEPTSSSDSGGQRKQPWTAIWAATVQPKVKLFIWHACKAIVPTQTKLFDKGISQTYSCLRCGDEAEMVDHLLCGCEFAQRVWKESPAMIPPSYNLSMPFAEFISRCVEDLGSPALEIVFTTAWALWKARNALFWNAQNSNVSEICQHAAELALDFLETRQQCEVPVGSVSSTLKWQAPAEGNYKLNVSCHGGSNGSPMGLGSLIRDSLGLVMAAKCSKSVGNSSLLQSQAKAVLLAIDFAFSIGFRRLEVEVGNQELLGLINLNSPSLAPIGVLVDDIRNWVPLFHFISFSFISKNCNKASRALATEAVSSNFEQVWLEDYPTCITSFVQMDSLQ